MFTNEQNEVCKRIADALNADGFSRIEQQLSSAALQFKTGFAILTAGDATDVDQSRAVAKMADAFASVLAMISDKENIDPERVCNGAARLLELARVEATRRAN